MQDNHILTIQTELAKVKVSDMVIATLRNDYLPLVIAGKDDKVGLDRVHQARMEVRALRLAVEDKRVELKADSLAYGRAVDAEAKRLTSMLEPIEAHLLGEEERVKAEIEFEKQKKQRIIDEMIKRRTNEIVATGAQFDGYNWKLEQLVLTTDEIALMVEDIYQSNLVKFQKVGELIAEAKKKESEERARVAKEQEEERQRLAKQKAEQDAKEAELKAAQDKNERDALAEKARLEGIEQGKRQAEAAENARKLQKEKERVEAEAEAKRVVELAPEKEKVQNYIDALMNVPQPVVKNKKCSDILKLLSQSLDVACDTSKRLK